MVQLPLYLFFFRFFSLIGYYEILCRVLCTVYFVYSSMFSFNFELGFPSVLCFPLLEFMVKILNIRFKYFEDFFVAEVLLLPYA